MGGYEHAEEDEFDFSKIHQGKFGRTVVPGSTEHKHPSAVGQAQLKSATRRGRNTLRGNSELLRQPKYQIHGSQFNFSPNRNGNNTMQKALLKSNLSKTTKKESVDMGRYVHQLDERLSIPKFTKGAEMTDK